ncbi:hypothetical protein J1605_013491 [Eschrichtius robustus]|uniref:Uncharacterized protein n=1 Tax=Eschrichtius robustus TaxID=9764 RepID=A0AB34GHJ5_ESCRO|nr:hypothetical protein J1605_013491 [Eschrichtius robustus]
MEVSRLGHGPSADRLPSPTPQSQYIFLHGCLLSRILEGAPAPLSTCSSRNLVRWGAGSPSLPPTGCQLRPRRAEETGSGSWAASGTPDTARAPPRPQPIRVRSFPRACSERVADGSAGFLGEHEVAAGRAARRRGVPSCHHFCGLSHGAPLPVTHPSSRSRPSRTRRALRCPLPAMGRTARPPVSASGLVGGPGIGRRPGWDLWRPHPHPRPADGCCHERSPPAEDGPAVQMPEAWLFPRGSRKERPVQRLQFPCGEPGQELPTMTLLPFLAAVGQCCSRGLEKPGTLLSHCRCRWTGPGRSRQRPHCPAAWGEGQDTAPSSLCPDVVFRESVPRRPCPLGPRLAVAVPGAPPRSPGPGWVSPRACLGTRPCPHPRGAPPTRGPLQQGCGPAGHLPGHGPAAAAGFVDVVTVALQQSQACGLMTPTLPLVSGGALDSEPVTRGEGAQLLPCVQQDRPGPAPRDPAFPFSAAGGRRRGLAAAWPERLGFLGLLRSTTVRESGEGKPGGEAERRAGVLTVATPSPMAHLSPHQPRGPGRLVPEAGPQLLPVEGLGDTESLDKPEQEAPKGVRPRIGEGAGLSLATPSSS